MMGIKKIFFVWIAGLFSLMTFANHADATDFLPPEKAFQVIAETKDNANIHITCLLYTSPSPRDRQKSRMPSSA